MCPFSLPRLPCGHILDLNDLSPTSFTLTLYTICVLMKLNFRGTDSSSTGVQASIQVVVLFFGICLSYDPGWGKLEVSQVYLRLANIVVNGVYHMIVVARELTVIDVLLIIYMTCIRFRVSVDQFREIRKITGSFHSRYDRRGWSS